MESTEEAAKAGAGIVVDGDTVVVYKAAGKSLRNMNRRMLVMIPVCILMFVLSGWEIGLASGQRAGLLARLASPVATIHADAAGELQIVTVIMAFFTILPFAYIGFVAILYFYMRRQFRQELEPILTLTPDGLVIDAPFTKIGLLRWNEIRELRAYTFLYRYMGIVPEDAMGLARRMTGNSANMLRMNLWCVPIYRLVRIFIAPINIPQEYLPVKADEMVARINGYVADLRSKETSAIAAPFDPEVWPPPPASVCT